ncbi:Clr5 domain-containing protein [Nemania sp. FL0031]|nr:Clr5 domain-containing protein [Nemania sp. FL0031]
MPSLNSPRPEQISADATGIDFGSPAESAYSSTNLNTHLQQSVYDADWPEISYLQDTFSTSQTVTQTDIRMILFQLQTDLIKTLQPKLPPELQGNIEASIRTCVDSVLCKWAPIDSSASEPPLPARTESPCSDTSSFCPDLLRALSGSHILISDFFNPKPLKPRPFTQSADVSAADTTSPVPSHDNPGLKTSSTPERSERTDRPERQSGRAKWDKYKDVLCRLYVEENLPIQEVMKIMKERHGFSASVKQYRYQIGEKWGWKKYNGSTAKNGLKSGIVETTEESSITSLLLFKPGERGLSPRFDQPYDTSSSIVGLDDVEYRDQCDMDLDF